MFKKREFLKEAVALLNSVFAALRKIAFCTPHIRETLGNTRIKFLFESLSAFFYINNINLKGMSL